MVKDNGIMLFLIIMVVTPLTIGYIFDLGAVV